MSQVPTVKKVALVTGGNKGIGLGICMELVEANFQVLMGTRNVENGTNAIKENFKTETQQQSIEAIQLDICNQKSIENAVQSIKSKYTNIDILVNNAGMAFKGDAFDTNVVRTTFNTNYYGTINVTQAILPLIKKGGRIINVSSRAGRLALIPDESKRNLFLNPKITVKECSELLETFYKCVEEDKDKIKEKGWPKSAYGMSKIGMSTYSRILARDNPNLFVAALCPGYVSTDMSSNKGTRTIAQGAYCPFQLCVMDLNGVKSGQFWATFYEKELKEANLKASEWRKVAKTIPIEWINPSFTH